MSATAPTSLTDCGGVRIRRLDCERRRGVIARDRMGVKPLYYARCDDLLVFASELKSLLASGLVSRISTSRRSLHTSPSAISQVYRPRSRSIEAPTAHRLVVENGAVRAEPYWTLPYPDHAQASSVLTNTLSA